MRSTLLLAVSIAVLLPSWAVPDDPFPQPATFTTLVTTPLAIEGLAADDDGNLYTAGRIAVAGESCPVWRIAGVPATLTVVGYVPAPSPTAQCSPSGLAFDEGGDLFVADGAQVYRLSPDASAPPAATVFASGVPGTNGLAFDEDGNLWTADGTTGQGRVWRIAPDGTVSEAFRIPPMRNSVALGGAVAGDGVGRQARTFPPGTLANTAGGQDLVANGLAFDEGGDLLVADTARGALWRVEFDHRGSLRSRTGCDSTLAANTLCLEALWVADPRLEGTDGIALDRAGNVWADANERNAVVVVSRHQRVAELFRNPPDATTLLRNTGPLEFPTSPVLGGRTFCTANSDGNRRDNSPNSTGEASPAGPARGKISCLDQRLKVPARPLPVE
jgi:sugar lactone lactonase YvrE